MRVLWRRRSLEGPCDRAAIAIGIFDGVHLGHRALLRTIIELAGIDGIDSVAFTFDPHPAQVLAPDLAPKLLESIDTRLERIAATGVDTTLVESFDLDFAAMKAAAFVRDVLSGKLRAQHVVIGADFTFGNKQGGDVRLLRELGAELGFETHAIEPVRIDGLIVSSTKIREFVAAGNMRGAALLLGRHYEAKGSIVRGAGRGAQLGIPTANIALTETLVPGVGVYAGRAVGAFDGSLPAVINIGYTPTFGSSGLKVEAHILDYPGGQLYGSVLNLEFVDRLRDEQRFDGIDALKAQVDRDIERARALLAG